MAIPQTATILHHLRQAALRHDCMGLTDGQLLRSFLYRGDEAAFEALVRRHGPMVRGVCRRILRNLDDADDAFQAAFLVLLRKASTLATREVLGDWLHGVAYRTALKARSAAARRRMKEKQALRQEAIVDDEARPDWLPLLDEEIGRLPAKYRLPVVLCDLEGRTRKEAAQQLGWPEGTVSGRLSRARTMLARRLTRRGVTLSAAALAAGMAGEASAHLPFSLVGPICKAAMAFAAGSAAGSVPAHIAALTEGVVKAMFVSKLKNAFALMTVALILTAGAGAWRYAASAAQGEERPQEAPAPAAPKKGTAQAPKIYSHPLPSAVPAMDALPAANDTPIPLPRAGAIRAFQVDMELVEMKDGKRKTLAKPTLFTLENMPAGFSCGDSRTIQLGGGKTEEVSLGPTVDVVIRPVKEEKVLLDVTVSWATKVNSEHGHSLFLEKKTRRFIEKINIWYADQIKLALNDEAAGSLFVTVTVQEPKEKTIAAAEKRLKMAEYWRRTGHLGSALWYYRDLKFDYPNTIYAERAKERIIEMEKQLEKQTDLSEADRYIK
jgi:RNA polymerase sigma factor (sigma-70 family)